MERRNITYSGNVQGVGFRWSTRSIAANYQVVGFVCNLPDGRVQMQIEGAPAELDRFQADLADRLSRHIRSLHCDKQPATDEFSTFEIRI